MFRKLMLLGALLLVWMCAPSSSTAPDTGGGPAPLRGNPCTAKAGSTDRNAPIVCVDDTGAKLSVSPDPIRVHDVGAADRLPVVIQWYTVSGANDLHVELEPGCVADTKCDGNGHCMARTVALAVKTEKRCKYDVWTDKHPRLDPEVIVIPCC